MIHLRPKRQRSAISSDRRLWILCMRRAFRSKTGPPKYSVTANTVLRLRLNDPLTSKKAKVGDQFRSTVVDPVYAKGFQIENGTTKILCYSQHRSAIAAK